MRADGGSCDDEAVWRAAIFLRVRPKKTNGSFDVVNLRRESCCGRQPVIHTRNGPTASDQAFQIEVSAGSGAPRAAIHPNDQTRGSARFRQIEIEFEGGLVNGGVTNVGQFLLRRIRHRARGWQQEAGKEVNDLHGNQAEYFRLIGNSAKDAGVMQQSHFGTTITGRLSIVKLWLFPVSPIPRSLLR